MKKDLIKLLLKNIKFNIEYDNKKELYSASYNALKIKAFSDTEEDAIKNAKLQLEAELQYNSKFLNEFEQSLINQ